MSIRGDLKGTDYRDAFDRNLEPGDYTYNLEASGGGKVAFKIRSYTWEYEGKRARKWKHLVEQKSRVASGSALTGTFTVPEDIPDRNLDPRETTRIQFILTRKAGSKRVEYELDWNPA